MLKTDWQIALVSMPFARLAPSLQLGLLKAIAEDAGFPTKTFHFALDFAKIIGVNAYEALAEHRGVLVGEWLFSSAAFQRRVPRSNSRFLDDFDEELRALLDDLKQPPAWLKHIKRTVAPLYIDQLLSTVEWDRLDMVGFSSTFQQNAASFALARALKAKKPGLQIVFGGANFDGGMGHEWLQRLPFIDYVVVGEGDDTFRDLVTALSQRSNTKEIPGLISRDRRDDRPFQQREPVKVLDQLPIPDFDEYFEREASCFPGEPRFSALPFESSRGCWWGAKHHCTFCGLNGNGMAYRSKSSKRVMHELTHYKEKYHISEFEAVDNILDLKYLNELFPALKESGLRVNLFYEVKSNLKMDQLRLMKEAGVESVQPGIESLNTHLLRIMRKGVTGIQNVNFLRWCRFYGIYASWNLLHGFPGENWANYEHQLELIPKIIHLQPPMGIDRIWIERFSPIFNEHSSHRGTLKPEPSYSYVYPASIDLTEAAYFFVGELENTLDDDDIEPLSSAVEDWIDSWNGSLKPTFTFSTTDDSLRLIDLRELKNEREILLTGLAAEVYRATSDRPSTVEAIQAAIGAGSECAAISQCLHEMVDRGLVMKEESLYLSLAIPAHAEL